MFLLSKNESSNKSALTELCSSLRIAAHNQVHSFSLGDYWLSWIKTKPWEKAYTFDNGCLIGRINLFEDVNDGVQRCTGNLPKEIHPASTGVKFTLGHASLSVEPFNITNVFYSSDVVSDMQLLVARLKRILPSERGVAVLSAVGYFPGNLTLFDEVSKIPFLFAYELPGRNVVQKRQVNLATEPSDEALMERLISIAPDHPRQYLGISGGYDSRFVLGILCNAGVQPTLCHLDGDETGIVSALAGEVNLPLCLIPTEVPPLPPGVYTLASDAQIYFRGGNYSKIREYIDSDSLYHTGLFADSVLKNAFKTAVKLPGSVRHIYPKLVDHALLSLTPTRQVGLRNFASYEDLRTYLLVALRFGGDYYQFSTKKAWANWFYYLHRGIRWTQATTADLSYFTHPIFLLSDLPALSYGISSSLWDNFKKDRVRRLCRRLLPELYLPFSDGKETSTNRLLNGLLKVKYEYLERYFARFRGRRAYHTDPMLYPKVNLADPPETFGRYFKEPLDRMLNGSEHHRSLKRTAVTLHYTLQFLENGAITVENGSTK